MRTVFYTDIQQESDFMKLRGLSKWVDNRFRKIGFIKHSESDLCVIYEKWVVNYEYIHVIEISHRKSMPNLIISYQKDINKDGFNNTVGLSKKEALLAILKMVSKGF